MDPIIFLAKLRGFAQPSEVAEPIELLRAGFLFHARGLINTKAIQNNLDWVWPYWVERQFNPADASFIPRAFSFSHINLTHRNWTAVGLPDVPFYPIVDPRGLVTPHFDGWSLDFWLLGENKRRLIPSKLENIEQTVETKNQLRVQNHIAENGWSISTEIEMQLVDKHPHCVIRVSADAPDSAQLAVVVRPYNPEGISFIESIATDRDCQHWLVNGKDKIIFHSPPEKCVFSNYKEGDVLHGLPDGNATEKIECPVSMATGAALFSISSLKKKPLEIHVPITDELNTSKEPAYESVPKWDDEISSFSRLQVPDGKIQFLYDTAISSLVLHSPLEVYPGPYTYKRFWYRDAAFILNAMITLGARARTKRCLDIFPKRQTHAGYFLSQDGEWDSNGEAIWAYHRYLKLTGEACPEKWLTSIERGAEWILKKRLPRNSGEPHAGLLPAGFSAEHLGPNDYYYWDNFWGVAGLRCAAELLKPTNPERAKYFSDGADEYLETIIASFKKIPDREARGAISASPHRRMDAGAVGSLVADFPLQLFPPGETRIVKTADYLLEHSFFDGGFFQNMIHSGINAYLTIHMAQVLLRAGDLRALELIDAVARLASPTGQWPEAIHPQTKGGCMGDGQHIWAAAEWALMIRNLFVREENDRLIVGSGIFPRWLQAGKPISFGPTFTRFGSVSISFQPGENNYQVTVEGNWFSNPPKIEVRVPGFVAEVRAARANTFLITPQS
ncbi:MAG: hypothetical protein ABI042_00715 [Verrucomicrobiota bacterium]